MDSRGLQVCLLLFAFAALSPTASAQQYNFIGELRYVTFDYCPVGWVEANGQLLDITQNQALFTLIGATYGGDGTTNFALPDLRDRAVTGVGAVGSSLGVEFGASSVTLTTANLPAHSHTLTASSDKGVDNSPANNYLAQTTKAYISTSPNLVALKSNSIGTSGGGQAFSSQSPSMALRACIAFLGIYPSRI